MDMLFAMKDNRQYEISKKEKEGFINQGYRIASLVDGELKYEEVETKDSKEIIELKEKIGALEAELAESKKEVDVPDKKEVDKKAKDDKKEDK